MSLTGDSVGPYIPGMTLTYILVFAAGAVAAGIVFWLKDRRDFSLPPFDKGPKGWS